MTAAQRVKRFRRLFDCSGFIKHKKNTVIMKLPVNLMLFTSASADAKHECQRPSCVISRSLRRLRCKKRRLVRSDRRD